MPDHPDLFDWRATQQHAQLLDAGWTESVAPVGNFYHQPGRGSSGIGLTLEEAMGLLEEEDGHSQ